MHAGARLEQRLRRPAARRSCASAATTPTASPSKLRGLVGADRNALGRELRARVEARHSVEHWADEVLPRWPQAR